jgi:outer membrane protein TolC
MKIIAGILLFLLLAISGNTQKWTLQQTIDSALKNNYSIRISVVELLQARAKVDEIKTGLLPKMNTAFDYRFYTNLPYQLLPASIFGGAAGTYKEAQFGLPHNINANVQIIYPLYNQAIRAAVKTVETAEEITALQQLKTKEDIALEVSNVYYNAQVLIYQLSFVDTNIINSRKLLSTVELLHQQKMAKGTDEDKLRLLVSQLLTQKATLEDQYNQVLNILKFLAGVSPEQPLSIQVNAGVNSYQLLSEQSITDILLAEKQIGFLAAEKKSIEQTRLPVINLNGLYGTTGFANTGPADFLKFFPLGYAGIQLAMPLYTGNLTKQKIRGKELEIDKAALRLEMLKVKNTLDKVNNSHQLSIAIKNLHSVQLQITTAQLIYSKTVLQQKEGMATLTDVLLTDNSVREAQQNYIIALVALRRAELDYNKITGNLIKLKP